MIGLIEGSARPSRASRDGRTEDGRARIPFRRGFRLMATSLVSSGGNHAKDHLRRNALQPAFDKRETWSARLHPTRDASSRVGRDSPPPVGWRLLPVSWKSGRRKILVAGKVVLTITAREMSEEGTPCSCRPDLGVVDGGQ